MPAKKRATIRDVAAASGFAKSTVSMALKGDPSIPEETRVKIEKAAAATGYFPDPKISKLMGHLSQSKKKSGKGALALVSSLVSEPDLSSKWFFKGFYHNVRKRAAEYGYEIDFFRIGDGEDALSARRIVSVLKARGIEGLLFLPIGKMEGEVPLPSESFSCMTCTNQFTNAQFNCSFPDYYGNAQIAFNEASSLGYKRFGLVLPAVTQHQDNHRVEAAYLRAIKHRQTKSGIPIYRTDNFDHPQFEAWLTKHKPDIVFSPYDFTLFLMLELGLSVPDEIGFIQFNQMGLRQEVRTNEYFSNDEISGVDTMPEKLNAAAIDMLVAMINRGERGIPDLPMQQTLLGRWHPAQSTKSKKDR